MTASDVIVIHNILKAAEEKILVRTGYRVELSMLEKERELSVIGLIANIAGVLEVSAHDIVSPSRKRDIVDARFIAITLCINRHNIKPSALGRIINRDHSSIHHAVAQTEALISLGDPAFLKKYDHVIKCLYHETEA